MTQRTAWKHQQTVCYPKGRKSPDLTNPMGERS